MANKILYLPMDESRNAKIAYDYSHSRADGVVTNATFKSGYMCKAVSFNGDGKIAIDGNLMNLDLTKQSLTYMAYLKIPPLEGEHPNNIIFQFQFKNGHLEEVRKVLRINSWCNIAVTKETIENTVDGNTTYDNNFVVYINNDVLRKFSYKGELSWMGIKQSSKFRYGYGLMDEVKIFDKALTLKEIMAEISTEKNQKYLIDGLNIKDEFDVCVSGSTGILNKPKMKKPLSNDFKDEHGKQVYLKKKYYESRHITLDCFISAANKGEFIGKVSDFEQIFSKSVSGNQAPTNRLMISVIPTKPLIYEVYCEDEIIIDKEWNDLEMVGTFKLKLTEAEPIKRILKVVVDDPSVPFKFTMQNEKYVNVYWGDGSVDYDLLSKMSASEFQHTYSKAGEYYIVIYGDMDSIKSLTSNAIVVWNEL